MALCAPIGGGGSQGSTSATRIRSSSALLRVARNLGSETLIDCPICVEAKLVHVSFAFGPHLPACGRALESPAELAKLARRGSDVVCYVVEVCKECSWNHLVRMFAAGSTKRAL